MIWAIETIFSLCLAAKRLRFGTRAMVPSSFITSQMIPAGESPASRARSTAASVWPALQHPAWLCPQGEDVARHHEVAGATTGVHGHPDGAGPVGGGDPRGHAFSGLDGGREGCSQPGFVAFDHVRDPQTLYHAGGHRQAN